MATQDDFSGTWRFTHWYPTSDDSAEESTAYEMEAQQTGKELVLETPPGKKDAYMFVRLTLDQNIATGSWHENAALEGPFKGSMYSGAGQLIISDDKKKMEGLWA